MLCLSFFLAFVFLFRRINLLKYSIIIHKRLFLEGVSGIIIISRKRTKNEKRKRQMSFIDVLKIIALGVVEGVTEWLPVSSTGHLLLLNNLLKLNIGARPDEFWNVFLYVIQLGAILAVVVLFWNKMFPFQFKDKEKPVVRKDVFSVWFKVVVACVPGAIATLVLDNLVEEYLSSAIVVAATLIAYGVAFIIVEKLNKKREPKINDLGEITYLTALYIGLFQVLSIIPGTSRSGATIIGALIIGVSRTAAAEFTFFLAVPVMIGMSLIKVVKYVVAYGFFGGTEILAIAIGMVVAFLVSVAVIRFLLSFIKENDFQPFGWYRIALGIVVIAFVIAGVV